MIMDAYKKILVAIDFSDVNTVAVERAKILVRQDNAKLVLLHVIEHFPYDGPLTSAVPENIGQDHQLVHKARAKLNEFACAHELGNAQQEVRITTRSARKEILRFAEVHGVDLIMVAPHGRGLIGALGSTAMGVLNGATCDVLTVRELEEQT